MTKDQSKRFTGKSCVVTGAASGMGRATTLQMAKEGGQILALDVNREGLAATASMAAGAGAKIETHTADLTDADQAVVAIELAVEQSGRLDVLCNVAGVGGTTPLDTISVEQWRRTMAINVDALFYLCQAAMPHLLETGGNIVNVASTAGLRGQAYMLPYVTSKHAVIGLTRTLAIEFGRRGVRVNAVWPGGTETPLLQQFMPPKGIDYELLGRTSLIEERCQPEDIARMICFTASDEARLVNGAIQSVDGGATA